MSASSAAVAPIIADDQTSSIRLGQDIEKFYEDTKRIIDEQQKSIALKIRRPDAKRQNKTDIENDAVLALMLQSDFYDSRYNDVHKGTDIKTKDPKNTKDTKKLDEKATAAKAEAAKEKRPSFEELYKAYTVKKTIKEDEYLPIDEKALPRFTVCLFSDNKFVPLSETEHQLLCLSGYGLTARHIDSMTGQKSIRPDDFWTVLTIKNGADITEVDCTRESVCVMSTVKCNGFELFSVQMPASSWLGPELKAKTLKKERYYFLSLNFNMFIGDKSGHVAVLVFDLNGKTLSLLDHNGQFEYFGHNREAQTAMIKLFTHYCKQLKFTLQEAKTWNPENRVLNQNDVLYGGHCVIISILLVHMLYLTQDSISAVFTRLSNLDKTSFSYLISAYSAVSLPLLLKHMRR